MEYLDIPEWEIEEAIARTPAVLGLEKTFQNPKLVGKQVYLRRSGRFIDMLFVSEDKKYVIVELKKTHIDDPAVIFEQLIPYRDELSTELKISKDSISCVLATTHGLSSAVLQTCKQEDVCYKQIDEKLIFHLLSKDWNKDDRKKATLRLLRRRYPALSIHSDEIGSEFSNIVHSVEHYIEFGEHDAIAKTELAKVFERISSKAPLCAHEVSNESYESFSEESDRWFWLFYSVLDRRANAVTFVNASHILKKAESFDPKTICQEVRKKEKDLVIQQIRNILADSDFPLSSDTARRDLAMPTSIVEAALWYEKYDFISKNIRLAIEERQPDQSQWARELFDELKKDIYGVGDRIAGQIVRGFVLKDGWGWVVNIPSLLEKCDFNVTFASKARLSLLNNAESYSEDLQAFGDKYINGNYAIISHVLWYIRKRYCVKPKKCFECPVSGYCNYYYRSLYWKVPEQEMTLLDLINLK